MFFLPIENIIDKRQSPQLETLVEKSHEAAQNVTQMVSNEKWKCKNCGSVVGENDGFCRNRGSPIKVNENKEEEKNLADKECEDALDTESRSCEHSNSETK